MKVVKSRAFKDRLRGHKESILALFSPYGEAGYLLYSASKDGSVRAWDLVKRQITIKLLLSRIQNETVSYEPQNFTKDEGDKKEGDQQQPPAKKNQQEANALKQLAPTQSLSSATFSQHSVFGAFEDGALMEWVLKSGQIKNHYKGHTQRITGLQVMESGKLLVSGSADSTIRTWNIEKGETEVIFKVAGPVNSLRVRDREIHALVNRNIFYQINTANNSVMKCIKFNNTSITSFILQDNMLVFGTIENKIEIYDLAKWDPENNTKLEAIKVIEGIGGWVLQTKHCNGLLYCGCDDRRIRVFSLPEIKQVEQLAGHDDGVISIEFADNMLYTGAYDHSIRSWDIKEMMHRIREREMMVWEDLESKKYEVYYSIAFKGKKKKLAKKKK